MYSIEKFYDHYIVKNGDNILYHVDTLKDAENEVKILSNNEEEINKCVKKDIHYKNYTVLHLHTELSLLDSCTNHKLYADKAVELGQKAICYTEHGNIYSWVEKKMYANKVGLKYLHGVEIYLTATLEEKVRDNYHTILIAKNYKGFQEINTLIDLATQTDHFYYKPRITFDEFKNISNNVIKLSACLASPLSRLRDESLIQYYDYLEIQPHINSKDQIEYNQWLYKMSKKYNKPLVACTDTHNINKYKAECRSILQSAKGIVFTNEDEFDLTYKSYDELVNMFERQNSLPMDVVLEAIENTNKIADMCEDFKLDTSFKYPKLYDNEEEVLKKRINTMYKDKVKRGVIKPDKQYSVMVKEEMRVFKKIGMVGFMLFMSELVCWCWDNGIPVGFCRGSCGGSMIAYLTDIIDVNPLVWHTMFSRFANESRKELGDIDLDISPSQRHLVYDHIIESFGNDKTAYILAIGTISDKGTIDEIGRALKIPLDEVKSIKKEYENNPEEARNKYPKLFYYFDGLVNTTISQSMHPAGIIVSPITLPDNYGTFWSEGKRILCINMNESHEVSLNKYDILGLKNVEIIKDTCELANISYPKSHELNWNDKEVWKHITDSPVGIFQFESDYAFKLLKAYNPTEVNSLSLVNASLRPSGESYRDRLIAGETNKNPSELIDKLLAPNKGFLCIEESQKILLKNGSKAIKDVCVGDEVYTIDGLNKVNKVYDNGYQNVIKISTKYNSITCTPEHKIFTERGWVKAGDLNNGDCIICYCGNLSNETYDYDKLKFIGWFLGDGCSGGNKVGFINLDFDVVSAFKSTVERIWEDLEVYIDVNNKSRVNKLPLYKCNIKWRYIHHNYDKPVHKYLDSIGLRKKHAIDKFIPEFVFNLNRECMLVLLGAYTDTDSCLKNNTIGYKTASEQLANDLSNLLNRIGYLSYITPAQDREGRMAYHVGVLGGNELLQELKSYSIKVRKQCGENKVIRSQKDGKISANIVLDWLSSNNITINKVQKKCGISLYHSEYVSIYSVQKIANMFNLEVPVYINDGIKYCPIEIIEDIGIKHVYDLEINNIHNYIANGIVVHNCFQEDTIKFLQQVCGLSGSDADNVRRAIGRKQKDRLEAAMPQILEGYCKMSDKPRDIAEQEAKEFLQIIEDSANYQFG